MNPITYAHRYGYMLDKYIVTLIIIGDSNTNLNYVKLILENRTICIKENINIDIIKDLIIKEEKRIDYIKLNLRTYI